MGHHLFHISSFTLALVSLFFHPIQATDSNETNTVHQCCLRSPLACSINDFGASLVKSTAGYQNVFVSTFSIYVALIMVYLGAEGETARQISRTLKLHDLHNQTEFHTSIKNLLMSVSNNDDNCSFFIANGVFVQQNVSINNHYKSDVQNFYNAVIDTVDFAHEPENTKETINTFVAEYTRDKIAEFLLQPLASSAVIALMNAVYFKGLWETQFSEEQTTSDLFYVDNCRAKPVQLMNMFNSEFPFYWNYTTGDKFLELPYKNGSISMLLALRGVTQEPELTMDSDMLCFVKQNLQRTEMNHIALPKFQLRHKQDLVPLLRELGIEDVFDARADLRWVGLVGQEEDLKVSSVLHEAAIDVDEQGSEPAAITNFVLVPLSLNPNRFIVDRPFSFYIVDNANDIILFSGHVHIPE